MNLKTMFTYMHDVDFPYVVLRNFENLPYGVEVGEHSDLDLLVYDLEHFLEIFPQAKREHPAPRVRFKMPLDEGDVYMDLRSVGDGYYPSEFQAELLNTREWNESGFYTPNPINFRIALAYHAVHHKNHNSYQRHLGDASIEEMLEALKASPVGWEEPEDPTVGRFYPYWKGATSIVSKSDDGMVKRQTSYKGYDLLANETRILEKLDSRHFPKIVARKGDDIIIEDCGEQLTADNLPDDWKTQLTEIIIELDRNNVVHRDIKPDNLMVKGGVIKLIDFGWATLKSDPEDTPPSCLGYPYKPSWGYDDEFSMKKVIKEYDYLLEEAMV